MPNKYSHAFVLSRYEARGFISPYQSFHSPDDSEYQLSIPSTDGAASPPLTAVPVLSSDSSTASSNSSLGDPPTRPIHSASSSVVTEIYAPQSPAQSPPSSPIAPFDKAPAIQQEEEEEDFSLSSPRNEPAPSEPPPFEPLRPPSRFSSYHNFSAFFNPPPAPERRKRPSRKYDRNPPPGRSRKTSLTSTHEPEPASSRRSSISVRSYNSKGYTPHKRLESTFDTESLDSLHLSREDGGRVKSERKCSPNMDVLPWEYDSSQSSELAARHMPEFSDHDPRDTQPHPDGDASIIPSAARRSSTSHPSRTTESSSHYYNNHEPMPSDDDFTLGTDPLPSYLEHQLCSPAAARTLSRSSSYDSVAPPPIRITPRTVILPTRSNSKRAWGREKG